VRSALLLTLLLMAGPLAAAPKPVAAARPARATIEPRLQKYQPDPAAWRGLGPGTDLTLIEIAGDGKVEVLLRARAVSTLGYFPTPAARKFLETTIEGKGSSSDPGDRLLVGKAAVSLGWLGGIDVPGRLAPLLTHPDADVRLDAAIGLGLTRLPSAAEALRKRLELESVARVRAQMSRQIQVIEDARASAVAGKK
jgi:HEAT repeat protein